MNIMVRLHTLGTAAIQVGDTRLTPASSRAFAALLYLAARRGEFVARSTLAALLFPDADEASGLHNLRQQIYRLRQSEVPLDIQSDGVQLPANTVQDDYSILLDGRPISGQDIDRSRGGFLPGYSPEFSRPYSEWLDEFRGSVTLRLRTQFIAELTRSRRTGQWDRVASVARACLALDPLNDEATCALAEALALAGSKHEAVALLDAYLGEVGGTRPELRVPATVLRRRIAERMPDPIYRTVEEAPLIGREQEMAALQRAFVRARGDAPQTVLIIGDPGIGKSRLVSEFGKLAVLDGAMVTTVALQPHDKRRPLAVFMDLIPLLRALPGALGCAPESLQFLVQLTAVDTPSAPAPDTGQPRTIFANATRAIADLLDAVSSEAPLVIIVEDVHWIDQLSLMTLSDLTLGRPTRPVLMALTSRDERVLADAPAEIVASPIALAPLDADASDALMRRLLHNTPGESDPDLRAWCLRAADGNPYFMHALATHHAVTGERFAVPPSLTELLARRLDRLPRRVARVFDACVLLGKHATIRRLQDVLGVAALDLAESLGVLEDGGFVVADGVRLRSSHYLLSDVALQRVPDGTARLLHGAVARVLEAESPEAQDASVLWDAAEHWVAAGDRQRAIDILEEHAGVAAAQNQVQLAVELLDMALELAHTMTVRVSVAHKLLSVAEAAWDAPRIIRALDAARSFSGAHSNETAAHDDLELLEFSARRLVTYGDLDFRERLQRCVLDETASPFHRLTAARHLLGQSVEQRDVLSARLAFEKASKLSSPETDDFVRDVQLIYEMTFGDIDRGIALARNLLEKSSPDDSGLYYGRRTNAVIALYIGGYFQEVVLHLQAIYDSAATRRLAFPAYWAAAMLGTVFFDAGELSLAHDWIGRAESADTRLPKYTITVLASTKIRLALQERRLEDAAEFLELVSRYPALNRGRFGTMTKAYSLRLRQLRGAGSATEDEIADLIDCGPSSIVHGLHDDIIAIVWHLLVALGQRPRADDYVDDYLANRRRDRFPPVLELREVLAQRDMTEGAMP